MDYCSGCTKWFKPRGFVNHLCQTHKEKCRAFLARLLEEAGSGLHADSDEDGVSHEEENDGGSDEEDNGSTRYEEDDDADAGAGSERDNDEEDDDLLYLGDEYWPEAPVPAEEVGMNTEMDILADPRPEPGLELELGDDQQEEVNQARDVRWAAEEEFQRAPVVVSFPSNAAGAPIANVNAVLKYESYQNDLVDLDNIWAPFSSQLDWEVARWAKLRGPSSTAFTELLNIKGVSA